MKKLKPASIPAKASFVGRLAERDALTKAANQGGASLIVVYGRRRVGKTELIEQTFANRNLLKFEGVEGGAHEDQIREIGRAHV